jgi:hypothetical protein
VFTELQVDTVDSSEATLNHLQMHLNRHKTKYGMTQLKAPLYVRFAAAWDEMTSSNNPGIRA